MYKDNRVLSLNREDKEHIGELKDNFIDLHTEASAYIDKKDLYKTLNCIRKLKEIQNKNDYVIVIEPTYYEY